MVFKSLFLFMETSESGIKQESICLLFEKSFFCCSLTNNYYRETKLKVEVSKKRDGAVKGRSRPLSRSALAPCCVGIRHVPAGFRTHSLGNL